jgi:hypothetical protein
MHHADLKGLNSEECTPDQALNLPGLHQRERTFMRLSARSKMLLKRSGARGSSHDATFESAH